MVRRESSNIDEFFLKRSASYNIPSSPPHHFHHFQHNKILGDYQITCSISVECPELFPTLRTNRSGITQDGVEGYPYNNNTMLGLSYDFPPFKMQWSPNHVKNNIPSLFNVPLPSPPKNQMVVKYGRKN